MNRGWFFLVISPVFRGPDAGKQSKDNSQGKEKSGQSTDPEMEGEKKEDFYFASDFSELL